MPELSEKFCPVCKNINDRSAVICRHCGAALDEYLTDLMSTTGHNAGAAKTPAKVLDSFIDENMIPEGSIAIYAAGMSKPLYPGIKDELIIGRKTEETSENFLDFSNMDGFNLGLSRRHGLIRSTADGYEAVDLSSTNGTWLNDERLVPNKPYRLTSGSQLRVGRLRLLVLFQSSAKDSKK